MKSRFIGTLRIGGFAQLALPRSCFPQTIFRLINLQDTIILDKEIVKKQGAVILYCNTKFKISISLLIVIAAFGGPKSLGCSVPVFRYALERWPADYYLAEIEYSHELSGEAKSAAELLKKCSEGDGETLCNLDVRLKQVEGLGKPKITLHYPRPSRIPIEAWSGELNLASVKSIVDSPVRKEIVKRLIAGESAVWIFLESGNSEKDAAALEIVKENLVNLQEKLQLPEEDLQGLTGTGYDPSLVIAEENEDKIKISFSVISVSRQDPAEKLLVDLLLKTEKDLLEYDEPMVFPVFGRGRILFAIMGKGINEENITQTCLFLTGPCSCQIKSLNPGVDMLVSVDWDRQLSEAFLVEQIELPELSGLTTVAGKDVQPEENSVVLFDEAKTSKDAGGVIQNVLIVTGAIIALVVVTSLLMTQVNNKKRKFKDAIEKHDEN